jgi:DNA-binding MarR family transcriptional regulator
MRILGKNMSWFLKTIDKLNIVKLELEKRLLQNLLAKVIFMSENSKKIAAYNSILINKIDDFIKEKFREYGYKDINPSNASVLCIVFRNGGKIKIGKIYDSLLKHKTTITESIKRLVKKGYLKKIKCTQDKRVTYVEVTEKAKIFREDFTKISDELWDVMFKGFNKEEREYLNNLIVRAIDNFNK